MNRLSELFLRVYIRPMPVYNHKTAMDEHIRQITRADSALPCGLHWVRIHITESSATLCTFSHIFTVSHNSPFIYHCQALFHSNTSVWCCQMPLLTIFWRNTILIILTSFSLNVSVVTFRFSTLCTFLLHRITNVKILPSTNDQQ